MNDDENTALAGAELVVLWNGPIRRLGEREREREWEKRRRENTETKTAARRRRRGTTVRGGLSLGRLSFRGRIAQRCRAHCCHDKRRPFPHAASADTRTARNVTRENPTRRARAKRVEKPRNDDINTHRRPPPPLGHGQYGVALGLAAGKPAGWQGWPDSDWSVARHVTSPFVCSRARPSRVTSPRKQPPRAPSIFHCSPALSDNRVDFYRLESALSRTPFCVFEWTLQQGKRHIIIYVHWII